MMDLFTGSRHAPAAVQPRWQADTKGINPAPVHRRKLVVANWKMYGSLAMCQEAVPLLASVATAEVGIVLCPPAPYLGEVARLAQSTQVQFSAQNVAETVDGARTGEWSAAMLNELGCRYAIVGHSERRQHHHEHDALIAAKAQACVDAGLTPIVCIGESWVERQTGQTEAALLHQLNALLATEGWRKAVIAYEPVWAIGTGQAATPEMAQEVHAFLRSRLAAMDAAAADVMPLLYGGSVKADNAAALFAMPDIDGALVGSASLQISTLLQIYAAACEA
ncbi:triose-phosphate isomerase [Andreprevotia chitinilytica]|uniref:triose-phosphate isomerase n=1 Tax=Andreprevotia chitinilytica TaxID=396808 RepID=UPI000B27B849|nr:triose-phosphate isomerase [Andreprevotia chitinilytica]